MLPMAPVGLECLNFVSHILSYQLSQFGCIVHITDSISDASVLAVSIDYVVTFATVT